MSQHTLTGIETPDGKVTFALVRLVRDYLGDAGADELEGVWRGDNGWFAPRTLAVGALAANNVRIPVELMEEFKRVSELDGDMEDYEELLEAQNDLD